MNASIKLLTLALLVFVTSCSTPEPSFEMIKGKWKVEGYEMFEIWEDAPDAILKGHSFYVEAPDTTFMEIMEIHKIETGEFQLQATVMMENEGHEIDFTLTQQTPEVLRFENPQHDMPQVVQYSQAGADTLDILLSGIDKATGEENVKTYVFVKVQ
jgi:hypothetical protein